jgi:hypothetical protein
VTGVQLSKSVIVWVVEGAPSALDGGATAVHVPAVPKHPPASTPPLLLPLPLLPPLLLLPAPLLLPPELPLLLLPLLLPPPASVTLLTAVVVQPSAERAAPANARKGMVAYPHRLLVFMMFTPLPSGSVLSIPPICRDNRATSRTKRHGPPSAPASLRLVR